jgi:long-subunit acyl-CoA synthetase (AMP-forming)
MTATDLAQSTAAPPSDAAEPATLCDIFQRTVVRLGDGPALRREDGELVHTWQGYGDAVRRTALGLARLGLRRGDTLALLMGNRPEFNVLDTAALHLGAPTVSVYQTLAPATIAHVLTDSQARVIVCEARHLPALEASGVAVEQVVVLDTEPAAGQHGLDALLGDDDPQAFDALWQAVQPGDLATIIYTSGTTGPPKGVELTHGNVLATLRATEGLVPIGPGDRTISALPMAHIAERWGTHYQGMRYGLDVTCVDDLTRMAEVLPAVRPQLWGSVPRIWEKLHQSLRAKLDEQPDEVRQVLDGAIDAGLAAVRAQQASYPEPLAADDPLMVAWDEADANILCHLRARLGLDELRASLVGAAPCPVPILEFFHALRIPISEVWGMSELSGGATGAAPGTIRFGTVGPPLPGIDVRLADDGEVEVGGAVLMRGYRNAPEKTAETMTPDGYLRTGDLGRFDEHGHLVIVGRKKEIIVTAGGKNIAPANVEAAVTTASPFVAQAVAIGDDRPYLVALLALDPEVLAALAERLGLDASRPFAELVGEPEVQRELGRGIDAANATLARVEQIRRWAAVPDVWEPGSDVLTPTMKLRRANIASRYADLIESLYTEVAR